MFKAINLLSGKDVVILDQAGALDELRSLDKQDLMVCQGCKQPVRVRAGEIRRWHFAHKHLIDCTYGHESTELLNARAVLYEWLVTKYGEKVTIEKKLDDAHVHRPVDCWVECQAGEFAYWIIDGTLSAQKRWDLQSTFKRLGIKINWVFLAQKMKRDQDCSNRIHLTTTERELMQSSIYDETVSLGYGTEKSLHYLDADKRVLTTFRGLYPVHPPQLFEGHEESHELAAILISPKNGEFVHPSEQERLEQYRLEKTEMEKRRRQEKEEQEKRQKSLLGMSRPSNPRSVGVSSLGNASPPHTGQLTSLTGGMVFNRRLEGTCVFCGVRTTDWWFFDEKTNTCKCRPCARQGRA